MGRLGPFRRTPRARADDVSYRYGRDWNIRLLQPIAEIDQQEAERCFETSPQLSVSRLRADRAVPDYTLVMGAGGDHVRVRVYDDNGSIVESFDWGQVSESDKLFLMNYKVWVYAEDSSGPRTFSQSAAHKAWVFRQDGTATCRETIKGMPEVKITHYRDLDMSGHWRERPVWGDWDRFGEHPEPDPPTGLPGPG